jgi:hypothetical protein
LLVVMPRELKQRLGIGDQFMQEILSKGKVLYAHFCLSVQAGPENRIITEWPIW